MPQKTLHVQLKTAVKKSLCSLNRLLGRYQEKLFVLGEGRSGTTWLMNLLNFDQRYRVLFEPFQTECFAKAVPYKSEYPFPDSKHTTAVSEHISRVMRGEFISDKVSIGFPKALFRGLLIKDVSAHLIIDPICSAAPDMQRIMLLRHPFAVAHSKSKAFTWPTVPNTFLSQHNSLRATLQPQRELIEKVEREGNELLKQILLWCMAYHIAFSARSSGGFVVAFYEHMVTDPDSEIPRVFTELNMAGRFLQNRTLIEDQYRKKSHVTQAEDAIDHSRRGKSKWREEWSSKTIDTGLSILEAFGMDVVYDDSYYPLLDSTQLRLHLTKISELGAA